MNSSHAIQANPNIQSETSYRAMFGNFFFYAKNSFPWHISRIGTMRYFPAVYATAEVASSLLAGTKALFASYRYGKNILPGSFSETLCQLSPEILKKSICLVLCLDFSGLAPQQKEYRIAADTFLLLASALGGMKALKDGTSQILSIANNKGITVKEKIKKLISGGLLISMGGWVLSRLYPASMNLYQGSKLFDSLSDEQKEGVLKYRSIHHLSKEKISNAVIIDGMSSKWGGKIDDIPLSFGELTYEQAKTRFYRVNSSQSFCSALEDASKQFGEKIQNLEIFGHGLNQNRENSNQMVKMNVDYFFEGTKPETDCILNNLKEKSQLFLISCNSATKTNLISLAERISKTLSSIYVTGIAAFFNPMLISSWVGPNNTLNLESHFPGDLNDQVVFPQNTIVYPPMNESTPC